MELKRSDDPFPDYFYKTENLNTKIELINYRDNLFWGLNLNENGNKSTSKNSIN